MTTQINIPPANDHQSNNQSENVIPNHNLRTKFNIPKKTVGDGKGKHLPKLGKLMRIFSIVVSSLSLVTLKLIYRPQ